MVTKCHFDIFPILLRLKAENGIEVKYLFFKIVIVYHEQFIKRNFIHILMEKHSCHKYFFVLIFFGGGGGGGEGGVVGGQIIVSFTCALYRFHILRISCDWNSQTKKFIFVYTCICFQLFLSAVRLH